MQSNHTETEKLREFNYCFNKYFTIITKVSYDHYHDHILKSL